MPHKRDLTSYVAAGLALVGTSFMSYLVYLHYSGASSEVCQLVTGFSCQIVNQSIYSVMFGIPLSILGVAFFLSVAAAALHPKLEKRRFSIILCASVFSLVFGLYLSSIEYAVIGAWCLFCELSKGVMVLLIITSVVGIRQKKELLPRAWLAGAFVAGLLFGGVHYLVNREPPIQVDYAPVAKCLTEKGVAMYASYICPACAKQKRLFGDSFQYVDWVECHPNGPDPQTERCIAKNISKTPTWIREQGGQELKRLVGSKPIAELAAAFECNM